MNAKLTHTQKKKNINAIYQDSQIEKNNIIILIDEQKKTFDKM